MVSSGITNILGFAPCENAVVHCIAECLLAGKILTWWHSQVNEITVHKVMIGTPREDVSWACTCTCGYTLLTLMMILLSSYVKQVYRVVCNST